MLDAQCNRKTQRVSLLEALDVVVLDSAMSTCCALCVLPPYYTHRFNRFGAGVVQVVKLVAQQMLLRIRIRIGLTHSIIP